MVAHTCNFSTQDTEAGAILDYKEFQDSQGYTETLSQKHKTKQNESTAPTALSLPNGWQPSCPFLLICANFIYRTSS